MDKVAVAFAKLAGIRKALDEVLSRRPWGNSRPIGNFKVEEVGRYFNGMSTQLGMLRAELPDLFADFIAMSHMPNVEMTKPTPESPAEYQYGRPQLEELALDIDHIFAIRASSELATPVAVGNAPRCVFISHGHGPEWREVQSHIEKDLSLNTIELEQEPNQGRTVLGKLCEYSTHCDSAVIVMTGDDVDAEGQLRARENVIHEIGFFQGKYGRDRVCVLYEDGVKKPSNIDGLVYAPFPKGLIKASYQVLDRELKAFYG